MRKVQQACLDCNNICMVKVTYCRMENVVRIADDAAHNVRHMRPAQPLLLERHWHSTFLAHARLRMERRHLTRELLINVFFFFMMDQTQSGRKEN